jgi:hypothetical protein
MVRYLCSREGRATVKYEGFVGQVTNAVIVAAESLMAARTFHCLVDLVAPPVFQDAWIEVWQRRGRYPIRKRPDKRGPVTVSDGSKLGAELVIITAGTDPAQAQKLTKRAEAAGAKWVWRIVEGNADAVFSANTACSYERSRPSLLCS